MSDDNTFLTDLIMRSHEPPMWLAGRFILNVTQSQFDFNSSADILLLSISDNASSISERAPTKLVPRSDLSCLTTLGDPQPLLHRLGRR